MIGRDDPRAGDVASAARAGATGARHLGGGQQEAILGARGDFPGGVEGGGVAHVDVDQNSVLTPLA